MDASGDRWDRADRIFEAALDLPPAERTPFLAAACGGDTELRELVARLLATADDDTQDLTPGGGLRGPVWDGAAAELAGEESFPPGTRVGPWRIVGELGRGGMAVVHLAERADGEFEQKAALKLIKRGIDTDEAIRRFHRERQILARARHPAIAQLLDGGITETGQPYFAMEHVDGRPIDRYCDEEQLSVPERLRLFLRIADAVSYAHRNLVVHRDIKPSNILVTADGHPKLLDFGIAKLLDDDAATGADLTRGFARLLTPAYASPEQVRGEPVTTASDVYQLGVLLYLLLTGRWPYRARTAGSSEMVRAICDEEATRPSTVITRTSTHSPPAAPQATPELIGRARATSPERLRRQLSGDLDRILLMALRKEPERRYATVAQLADDIVRYLEGRPVTARGDSLLYRTAKLLRRHAAAAATAAAALVLIVTLVVAYTWQLARERDRARLAAARATQVSDFLRGLFAVSAPTRSKGERVTARELLDRGAARIETELTEQPELQASMMTLMGDVYRELALYEEAEPLLELSVRVARALPAGDRRTLASSLDALAQVLAEKGSLDRARGLFEEALAIRQEALGPDHPDVARTLGGLGRVCQLQGEFEAARRHQERALEILEGTLGSGHPEVGRALKDLGATLRQVRDFEAAKAVLTRALELLRQGWEPDHPYIAQALLDLGDALRFTGEPGPAREQYETALLLLESSYGPNHPEVAVALTRLGHLLNAGGDPAAAISYHERALAIRREAFGPDHPLVAGSLNNLGLCHLTKYHIETSGQDLEVARSYLERAVAANEASLGVDHPEVAKALLNLAGVEQDSGAWREAVPLLGRVIEIRERTYGPGHSLLAAPLLDLGRVHLELGDPAAAEPLLRRALDLGLNREPLRLGEIIRPRIELGRCLTALGRFPEAEEMLSDSLAETGLETPYRVRILKEMVVLYESWGRPEEARRRRELAGLEEGSGER